MCDGNKCNLSGNKGEWSSIYVLLKLLGDGQICGADGYLVKDYNKNHFIDKITRNENGTEIEYRISNDGSTIIIPGLDSYEIDSDVVRKQCSELFYEIMKGKNSFSLPNTEHFLKTIRCNKLQSKITDGSEIAVLFHDNGDEKIKTKKFSITSCIGSSPTLVNASGSTNVKYLLSGKINESIMKKANAYFQSNSKSKVMDGMLYLKNQGIGLSYYDTDSIIFKENLSIINDSMPELVGELLKLYYGEGINRLSDLVERLEIDDPLGFVDNGVKNHYSQYVKQLLILYSLGMKSSKKWIPDADGNNGMIVVKNDGSLVYYESNDPEEYGNFLLRNTRLETPSTKRHQFAFVYSDYGSYYVKLNLQIRFVW